MILEILTTDIYVLHLCYMLWYCSNKFYIGMVVCSETLSQHQPRIACKQQKWTKFGLLPKITLYAEICLTAT